ncbi:hypothetical protein HPP92_003163 [Vanilla planifolia]|uniref:Uncharacterized protein n=1 Tax=Vanilla planifolia TaxID=51239 RepID=A0A835VGY7_VANPL|nr:hypothetical protein HPP92_003163 [Vanilla planifolia]
MAADKKQKKIEHQEEVERDPKLKECMDKLKEIQQKLFRLKAEARSKINEIEMQFTEIRRPIYEKRTEIIKTIPEFWMGVILPYLSTLEVQDGEKQNSDFVIIFRFDPNPFFGNSLLVRSYTFLDDGSVQRFWSVIDWKMQTGPHDDEPEEVQHGSVVGSVDEEEEDELKDTASS